MITRTVVQIRSTPSHSMAALTIASTLLLTTLAQAPAPVQHAEFPTPPRPSASRVFESSPSLLLTTLGTTLGPTPLVASDTTVPIRRVTRSLQFEHPTPIGLYTTVLNSPFTQPSWPNPTPRFTIQASISTTYAEEGQAIAPVAPAPHLPIEWRNPQARKRAPAFAFPNLSPTTLAPVASTDPPFRQREWRNPVLRSKPVQRFSDYFIIDETTASVPIVWRNPQLKRRHMGLLTWTSTRPLSLSEPAKPFLLTDWKNPRRRLPSPELGTIEVWRALGIADTVDDTPQSLSEWPTPPRLRASRALLTWTHNLLGDTLAPDQRPFVPVDFPNPQIKARAIDLLTSLEVRKSYYADDYPFSQTEWPLVVVPLKRLPETWISTLLDETLAVEQTPILSTERPNPALRPVQTLTFVDNLLQSTLTPDPYPVVQTEWPLFKGTLPVTDLKTWIQTRQAYHEDETPANQFVWPNPEPFRLPKGFGYWSPPQLGILGFPAEVDVEIIVRADVGWIIVRPDDIEIGGD